MASGRAVLVALTLCCSAAWAAPVSYDYYYQVDINTQGILNSSYGLVTFALLNTDAPITTATVDEVHGLVNSGLVLKTGNVKGSLGNQNDPLTISDAPPEGEAVNGVLQLGARFENNFGFGLYFDVDHPSNASNDVFLFALAGLRGATFNLFTFSGGELTVLEKDYVSVSRVAVTEPSSLAVLLLLLAVVGGTAFQHRRQRHVA